MRLKTVNKFVIGILCGVLVSLSIYSFADNDSSVTGTTSSGNAAIPVDEINNFAKVYAITKSYYVESVTDNKLIKGAINGMLTNLDPHSTYLDQDDFKQLTEMTTGSFAGLGIEVNREKDDSGIKIIAPIDGTPAYLAGIKSGDIIIKIDGQPVSGLTLDDAVKKMRGKVGTKVTLTISRKSELKPLEFTLTRANIAVKSIKYAMLAPGYAYIRVTDFQSDTVTNLVSTLKILAKQNPNLKGLVLDLRDDPGGILQAAVGTAGAFLAQNDLVVYTSGRAPNSSQKFFDNPEYYTLADDGSKGDPLAQEPVLFKTLPMVVLVNQGTASAAEIVSGALQDYKRAKIIGTTTFGKGSVQTVIPLSADTAIKLTTALYYTPKGRSIQAQGIKPDIIVHSEYDDLYDSWDISEASLDNHLNNPTTVQVSKDKDNTPIITPPQQISTQAQLKAKIKEQLNKTPKVVDQNIANLDIKNDFQLQWALNIIQGKPLPKQNVAKLVAQ